MGKMQRSKGHGYEREIAKAFRELYPGCERYLNDVYGGKGIDVIAGPYKIQCKRGRNYSPVNKLEEVNYGNGDIPLLATRGDKKKTVVCLYIEDFIERLKRSIYA